MTQLLFVSGLTILISALCSLLEAMILSTTTAEIESLKKTNRRSGGMLERFKLDIEETSSAILSLNTIANTAGAVVAGGLAVVALGDANVVYFSASMVVAILVVSEVIPKNAGVIYRKGLQPYLVYPLAVIRWLMWPVSRLLKLLVRLFLRESEDLQSGDEEIQLLAEKSAKEGRLTTSERDLIHNALALDDIKVSEIMTPRTVVSAFEKSLTIGRLFQEIQDIPFARLPVYDDNIDNVIGIVRRRDLLAEKANDHDQTIIDELKQEALYIPETASAADALQVLIKNHQQLAIVVDEYGSVDGVVTMEDIMESIIGQEIFEPDDPAVDMRELARQQTQATRPPLPRSQSLSRSVGNKSSSR